MCRAKQPHGRRPGQVFRFLLNGFWLPLSESYYLFRHPGLVRELLQSMRWVREGRRGRTWHEMKHELER